MGDFNGDGKIDTVEVVQTQFGNESLDSLKGNGFEIRLKGDSIRLMKISCTCKDIVLINEGNINNKAGDEISIINTGIEAPIVDMYTYTIVNKKMETIIGPSILGTSKDISKEKLQDYLIRNNDGVFQNYYDQISIGKNGKAKGDLLRKRIEF